MLPAIKIDEHFLNDSIYWEFPIPIAYCPGMLNDIAEFCKKS